MTTIYGWDMSHYDAPNIGTAVKEGYLFITHKAGGDATDNELDEWWASVRGLGPEAELGAYWVLYPGNPARRADLFLERLDTVCKGWRDRDSFILQVDCERWNGSQATVPGKADIKAFCDRLVARTGGRYRPIVYAPKWVYGDTLAGLGYPLWSSAYVSGSGYGAKLYADAGGDSGPGWKAYSGQVPAVWQFTSHAVIAGQTTCDANAFRGPLSSLKSLTTPSLPPPPTPRKDTMELQVEIPVLKQGDDDAKLPGYNLIVRIQRIVGVPDDGAWGPHTTAGIADWCDIKPSQATKLTEDIYRKVFGAAR
jgi:GH25 family lysozyme M1 (1,4-beta-N-acetylmuramidase)